MKHKIYLSYNLYEDQRAKEIEAKDFKAAFDIVCKEVGKRECKLDMQWNNVQFCVPNTNEVWARISWEAES